MFLNIGLQVGVWDLRGGSTVVEEVWLVQFAIDRVVVVSDVMTPCWLAFRGFSAVMRERR